MKHIVLAIVAACIATNALAMQIFVRMLTGKTVTLSFEALSGSPWFFKAFGNPYVEVISE